MYGMFVVFWLTNDQLLFFSNGSQPDLDDTDLGIAVYSEYIQWGYGMVLCTVIDKVYCHSTGNSTHGMCTVENNIGIDRRKYPEFSGSNGC